MKYCTSCGKELTDRAKFCTGCGTKCAVDIEENTQPVQVSQELPHAEELSNVEPACQEAMPANDVTPEKEAGQENPMPKVESELQSESIDPPMKKKKPISKGKIILFSILSVVLAVLIAVAVLLFRWYTGTEQQVLRALDSGDYDAAVVIMEEDASANESEALTNQLKERIANIKSGFVNGTIEYASAKMELDAIERLKVDSISAELNTVQTYVDNLNETPSEPDVCDYETTATPLPSMEESTASNELIYYIRDTRSFSDGVAWVEACNKEDGMIVNSQWVCIDTNGDMLFMLDPDAYTPDEFENGVALYKTSDGICNVIDKNGTIVFSSKDGLFDDVIVHGDGYFAVYKYKESFDAAGYEILFLNSKGERVIEYTDLFDEVPELIYCGDGIFANCTWQSAGGSNKYTFINVKDDTFFEVGGIAHNNDLSNIFVDGVGLVELGQGRMNDVPALIYADGTVKELNITDYNYYKYGRIADGGFVFTSYYNDKVESVRFYNTETETVTELGNYGERVKLSRLEGLHFDNGHLLLPLVGADGKNYYTIIDKSGQSLFDPVACDSAYAEGEDRIVVKYEEKTVVCNGKGEAVYELPAGQSVDSYQSGIARLVGEDHSIQDIYIDLDGNIMFDDEILFTVEE